MRILRVRPLLLPGRFRLVHLASLVLSISPFCRGRHPQARRNAPRTAAAAASSSSSRSILSRARRREDSAASEGGEYGGDEEKIDRREEEAKVDEEQQEGGSRSKRKAVDEDGNVIYYDVSDQQLDDEVVFALRVVVGISFAFFLSLLVCEIVLFWSSPRSLFGVCVYVCFLLAVCAGEWWVSLCRRGKEHDGDVCVFFFFCFCCVWVH